ncbi:unnamed protein product [Lathyrus oleraceus]
MYVLASNLKVLKDNLRVWNKNCFGNVHDKVKLVEQELAKIQEKIDIEGHLDSLAQHEKLAQASLEQTLAIEELFWKDKARDNSFVEEVIPRLVFDQANSLLTSLPSDEEIYSVVFNLKRDSAIGLDGFVPIFY